MALLRLLFIFPLVLLMVVGTVSCRQKDPNILYYTCPMHPQIQKDEPGRCPICGMTLVPVKKGEAPAAPSGGEASPSGHEGHETPPASPAAGDAAHPGVYIPPDRAALAGVKTTAVVQKDVAVRIQTIGQVANNPDLVVAQKAYLVARQVGDHSLQDSTLSKLQLMGMSDAWIKDLVKRGKPDTELYRPTGADRVIVEASVYENDLATVGVGQAATVVFTHQGNTEYVGKIMGLNPTLSPTTRAATAFIEIPQKILPLRAGMVVTVRLENHLGNRMVIPDSAVIDTGMRRVAVVVKDNYYDPREVEIGEHVDGMVVVKSGLQEGEVVVVAANFLIDSEAQLKTRLRTMSEHQH